MLRLGSGTRLRPLRLRALRGLRRLRLRELQVERSGRPNAAFAAFGLRVQRNLLQLRHPSIVREYQASREQARWWTQSCFCRPHPHVLPAMHDLV